MNYNSKKICADNYKKKQCSVKNSIKFLIKSPMNTNEKMVSARLIQKQERRQEVLVDLEKGRRLQKQGKGRS